jgi:hypothetical protein
MTTSSLFGILTIVAFVLTFRHALKASVPRGDPDVHVHESHDSAAQGCTLEQASA